MQQSHETETTVGTAVIITSEVTFQSAFIHWLLKTDFVDATRCLLVVTLYLFTGAAVLLGVALPDFWTESFRIVTLFYLGTEAIDQVKKLRASRAEKREGNSSGGGSGSEINLQRSPHALMQNGDSQGQQNRHPVTLLSPG